MRFRLRTLLIVLALGPPLLAWGWHHAPDEWAFWRKPKPVPPAITWRQAFIESRAVSARGRGLKASRSSRVRLMAHDPSSLLTALLGSVALQRMAAKLACKPKPDR
jgi:hypothetical protein